MCMKLDSGMHIGMHLVFFGRMGVTECHIKLIENCNGQTRPLSECCRLVGNEQMLSAVFNCGMQGN
jgi:hypothetical protein